MTTINLAITPANMVRLEAALAEMQKGCRVRLVRAEDLPDLCAASSKARTPSSTPTQPSVPTTTTWTPRRSASITAPAGGCSPEPIGSAATRRAPRRRPSLSARPRKPTSPTAPSGRPDTPPCNDLGSPQPRAPHTRGDLRIGPDLATTAANAAFLCQGG